MDDDLVALIADQHDDFEKVAGGVRSQDQPPIWILAKVVDRQRVLDSVEDVVLSNIVAVRRVVDLHTRLAYYEIPACRVLLTGAAPYWMICVSAGFHVELDRTELNGTSVRLDSYGCPNSAREHSPSMQRSIGPSPTVMSMTGRTSSSGRSTVDSTTTKEPQSAGPSSGTGSFSMPWKQNVSTPLALASARSTRRIPDSAVSSAQAPRDVAAMHQVAAARSLRRLNTLRIVPDERWSRHGLGAVNLHRTGARPHSLPGLGRRRRADLEIASGVRPGSRHDVALWEPPSTGTYVRR